LKFTVTATELSYTFLVGKVREVPMTESVSSIRISGMSRIEALEFREYLDGTDVRIEEETVPDDAFGEIALATAIVLGTAAGIRAVAAYLNSRRSGDSIREEIVVELPDGSRIHRTIEVSGEAGEGRADAIAGALEEAVGEVNNLAG
jgi:hypothetical protein